MDIQHARVSADATNANIVAESSDAFQKTVVDALSTSIGNKSNTATVSISGKTGSDVMGTFQELKRKGYKVSQSGTNLTITW